jgi:hypothetical protein
MGGRKPDTANLTLDRTMTVFTEDLRNRSLGLTHALNLPT